MNLLTFPAMLLSALSILFLFAGIAKATPDRIGNGGGVWVCENASHQVFDVMFMDVFEARREYQLNLPETQTSVDQIVQQQKTWIENNLSSLHSLLKHVEYVEKNIAWIDDVINLIPDGANKISPHPSTCKQGEWKAVQLVNFTDDFRILVRREFFDSSFMSNLEKAAVYLHEGLYSFLRTELGDTNSVRARAIVGFLLSDLSDSEKVLRIQKVLNQTGPLPVPSPAQAWICGIKPETYSALYTFEASTADKAKEGALKACIQGENHFGGNPGGGGFPGFPFPFPEIPGGIGGGGFGPPQTCKVNKVLCEQVTSSVKSKQCVLTNDFTNKTYRGLGRTSLEAQKEAINQCLSTEGDEHSCYSGRNMSCH